MAAIKQKPVDVVLVGFGWTGAIMGMELAEAGLKVLALERGEKRDTYPDFAYPRIADELTYGIRLRLFQEAAKETVTVRHTPNDVALPYRQFGSFLPGNGVGGAGVHWNGQHWRFLPSDFKIRGGQGKAIFKQAYEPLLPHDLLYRPKMGFSVPLAAWLRGPLKDRVRSALQGERMRDCGYFNPATVRRLIDEHNSGMRDHATALWMLLMFEVASGADGLLGRGKGVTPSRFSSSRSMAADHLPVA